MPDITPTSTNVLVCRGVPLDNKYNDTILFTDKGSQQGYFSGKAIYRYNGNFTYQRVQNRVNNYTTLQTLPNPRIEFSCRIPVNADKIYDCNYLCFQNQYDTNKWWYCFIKEINYINPNCCEIIYEIDAMQTFLFDFEVGKSFVEREHTETDDYFEHVCLEDDIISGDETTISGENITQQYSSSLPFFFAICSPSDDVRDFSAAHGGQIYDPITKKINGLLYIAFSNQSDLLDFLSDLANDGKSDECSLILTFPAPTQNGEWQISANLIMLKPTQLDGYTFHNKMLCSYPFRRIVVVSSQGDSEDFRPQLFVDANNPTFKLTRLFNGDDLLFALTPNYQKLSNKSKQLFLHSGELGAWASDTFKNWLAQHRQSLNVNLTNGIFDMIKGKAQMGGGLISMMYTGNGAGDVSSGLNEYTGGIKQSASVFAQISDAKHQPDQFHGTHTDVSFDFEANEFGFWAYEICLNRKALERIDDYFERYGYKVNKIKIPTPFGGQRKRPLFNYVKTVDVNLTGSVPTPQMNIIKSAFDSGITFWHNENVGTYAKGANDV